MIPNTSRHWRSDTEPPRRYQSSLRSTWSSADVTHTPDVVRQRNEHTTFDLATIQQPVAEDEEVELVEDRDDPYDEREGAAGAAGAAHETGGVSRAASASARPKRRR